jgi:choline dehydrogenase
MHSPLEPSIGWNKMQFALGRDGSRQSAFRAYLPARIIASLARHLHICTRAVGGRVIFSRGDSKLRAKALEVYSVDGHHVRVVQARCEIVLTCGALATPQLLMLRSVLSSNFNINGTQLTSNHSGVGPEEHLQQMGIEVIRHTPGVGTHLVCRHITIHSFELNINQQDHVYVPTSYNCPLSDSMWALIRSPLTLLAQLYKYLRYGAGWFLCMAVEVEIFGMSSLIDAYGTPAPATTQTKDPFDPNNIPDFAVMTVRSSLHNYRTPIIDKHSTICSAPSPTPGTPPPTVPAAS